MRDLVEVAKIGKSVGLWGEVKLYLVSDFPEQFQAGKTFTTSKNKSLTIETYNLSQDKVKFVGINTREDASALTNQKLYTTEKDTVENCKLEKDEYFWFDIEKCEIIEKGISLGFIKEIEHIGPTDYFIVETDASLVEAGHTKVFYLPYIDQYIESVDIDAKKVYSINAIDIIKNS